MGKDTVSNEYKLTLLKYKQQWKQKNKTVKNYGEVNGNRSASLKGTRIRECQAVTSIAGHSRQKLSKKLRKRHLFDNYFSAFRKMQDALFTCYSNHDVTIT